MLCPRFHSDIDGEMHGLKHREVCKFFSKQYYVVDGRAKEVDA